MEEELAKNIINNSLKEWMTRRRTLVDAKGKKLPDGQKTKLLPSGDYGVALQVTLEDDGDFASTRIEKERHELRICKLDTSVMRDKAGATPEQLMALLALCATFDIVVMTNVPPGEGLHAASTFKNLLSHHAGDTFDFVMLDGCTVFLRFPLAVLKSFDYIVFHDNRFKQQDRIKSLRVERDCVFLIDGEDQTPQKYEDLDDINENVELKCTDEWFNTHPEREVEAQRVPLELQITESVEDASKEEDGDDIIALCCIKVFD